MSRIDPRLVPLLLALPLATVVLLVGSASAGTPVNALTFSGALKGTLKITATTACSAGPNGVQLGDFNSKLSPVKATNWSVTILAPGNGTYKQFKLGRTSVVLASGFNGWVATSGSFTVHGKSGTVNATLGAHEGSAKGTVHVKGGWSCH